MTTSFVASHPRIDATARGLAVLATTVVVGAAVAVLVTSGAWYVVVALTLLLPAFVTVHRAPLVGVGLWVLTAALVSNISGVPRYAFWGIHRMMPVGVIAVLVITAMVGIRRRRLGRLGWPEVMMAGYVVVTAISIVYTSEDTFTRAWELIDRVVIPMCLYALVRLLRPGESALRAMVPVVALVIVSQAVIGALSWGAPGVVPGDWLGRAGSRTTGSLQSPSVYGVTMIAAGLFMLHAAALERQRIRRGIYTALFALAQVMAVLTFTRAVWLAALVAVVGAAFVHPRLVRRVTVAGIPLLIVLIMSGAVTAQAERLQTRLDSEETALARLPVAIASLQMFEERPMTGWGFGNFDRFDREFQEPVAGYQPEKDHSSHNLYLTQLAEQGILGFGLYVGPAVYWFTRTLQGWTRLPRTGFVGRKLVALCWLALSAHVAVNMFSNMTVEYGLGWWWVILGLIGSIVSVDDAAADPEAELRLSAAASP